jgi:hypothetical protein
MAVIWLKKQPGERRAEPSLICTLIKQVEQVTTFVSAGACQDSEHRDEEGR